jgi:Flp pilus assembly protein TadD
LLGLLGTISWKIGREQEARTFYRRMLELDPGNRDAEFALRQLEGAIPAAEYVAQPVRQMAPPPEPVQPVPVVPPVAEQNKGGSSLDDILARLRSTVAAAPAAAQPVQASVRPSADQLYRDAQAVLASGDASQGIAALERLVADYPVYALAHNDLGVLYSQQGNLERACSHHGLAVRYEPSSAVFRKNLAALYYTLCGRTDEAIGIYTALVKEYPADIEVLTALAIISNNNNLKEQAQVFIRRVLDFEPWNAEARQFLTEL